MKKKLFAALIWFDIILHAIILLFVLYYLTPFDSNVWGNVADWVMIIVTGITAYYLFKTLQSQQSLNKLQEKTTLIEQERYNLQILPDVTVTHDQEKKLVLITPINRDLKNAIFKVEKLSNSVIAASLLQDKSPFLPVGQSIPMEYQLNSIPIERPYNLYNIRIDYDDELDNPYFISIVIIHDSIPVKFGPKKKLKT